MYKDILNKLYEEYNQAKRILATKSKDIIDLKKLEEFIEEILNKILFYESLSGVSV